MIKLTARQQQVLDCIKASLEETGFPPTRAEIATELGFRSPNAAEEHLKALARKGAIEMMAGASRGIRVIDDTPNGLPIVGRVAAGEPILAQEDIDDYCEIPPSFFKPEANYLLEVHGDSMMEMGILDGDYIAVHRMDTARNGEVVVARVDNEVTVKRYEKKRNKITLFPENKDYSPIEVDLKESDFAIEGLYVGVVRRN